VAGQCVEQSRVYALYFHPIPSRMSPSYSQSILPAYFSLVTSPMDYLCLVSWSNKYKRF